MTSTISTTANTFTPILVDGFGSSRESRNIIHTVLGTNAPAITLRPASLRSGTLSALFTSLTLAQEFEDALASGAVLYFYDTDNPTLALYFVCSGDVSVELDDDSRAAWTVEWDYQEVAA